MEENTIDTTNRIPMLPDDIIHHILSYLLDNPKSRIRVSVLSKECFALTASYPFLNFHKNGSWWKLFSGKYDNEYILEKFYKYVESTVSRFCEQNISAHTLNISAHIDNSKEIELFERCIDLVLDKGLQMMDIRFGYSPVNVNYYHDVNLPMFRLPDTLLSVSSLTSLKLKKCELPLSLMVGVVKFKSLRLLWLLYLPIDEGVIEHLTKGCPLLEEIYLKHCYGFKTFCVKRHQNLLKVEIYCDERLLLERIDVEAPNLSYFVLKSNEDKAPSMFMDSCKKLTTFCYRGFPLKRFSDFLSNFPFLENVSLNLSSPVDNLKLSHHFLRRLELRSCCDLEEIDLNAPKLLSFEYCDRFYFHDFPLLIREDSSMSKGCMKCKTLNILWFEKLRKFLDKNSIFKVLKLDIHPQKLIDVEELKLIHSPPYELEHVELNFERETPVYVALVDAVLWCCRPRSLTLQLEYFTEKVVVEYTYEKLLQQEDEGQTNIKFVLKSNYECEEPFSDLNSLLKALSIPQFRGKITFIKEVVKPPHCTDCKSFGHSLYTCPKNVKEADPTAATMEELNEGFTEVIRRKNKGKMADQQAKLGHISGIRLNKPKPSFCRPKTVKENAHGKGSSTKPKEHRVASTSNTKSSVHFNISNSFEALNSLDEDGNGLYAPNQRVPLIANEVNEGLASKPSSSRGDLGDESDENDVLLPEDGMSYISSIGGGQDLE
ncbi:F-box domain containing protein [Tanacetum coccineum]